MIETSKTLETLRIIETVITPEITGDLEDAIDNLNTRKHCNEGHGNIKDL